jgi:hypothetical protein
LRRHQVFTVPNSAAFVGTFAASGVLHEYFVLAAIGWDDYRPGFMLLFFLAQAAAVLWLRKPSAIVHGMWLCVTTPLFVWPLLPLYRDVATTVL